MSYSYKEAYDSSLKYFNGDDIAADTFVSKYAMRDEEGNFLEKDPSDMHKRMAKELARIEGNYNNGLTEDKILKELTDWKIIPQGSVMSVLGTDTIASLSNCVVLPAIPDSYGGICYADEQLVHLMKRRCGVGLDISTLRPEGTNVSNSAGSSTGAVSFMERFSNTTREVAQAGRRGALMITMDIRHPDIEKFIEMKQDLERVTGANVSVRITDEFMRAVENDEKFILRFPLDADLSPKYIKKHSSDTRKELTPFFERNKLLNENSYDPLFGTITHKIVKARDLWNKIVSCAHNTAEPGLIFWDRQDDYSPSTTYPGFENISTNPCQPGFAKVLTKDGIRNFDDIKEGDKVWTQYQWATVKNKWYNGVQPVYKFITTQGRFIGTKEHELMVDSKRVKAESAEEVNVYAGGLPVSSVKNTYDIMDGLLIGDGSTHPQSKDKIYLHIGENDHDYFGSEVSHLIKEKHPANKYAWKVETSIKEFELPYLPEREVPDRFYYGNFSKVTGFLRGLFSANGSVIRNGDHGRVTLKSTSKILIEQVQDMLSAVGIRSYYTTNRPSKVEWSNGDYISKESYDLNISTDRDLFYKNIGFLQGYKNRKLNSIIPYTPYSSAGSRSISKPPKKAEIVGIEYLGEYDVYDIEVDSSDHAYWTCGLQVSNCSEIAMQGGDTCRLTALNLTKFVQDPFTDRSYFDHGAFSQSVRKAVRLMDDIVDLEIEQIDKIIEKVHNDPEDDKYKQVELDTWKEIRENAVKGRRTGLGITGLGDTLAMLGFEYDSKDGKAMTEQIMDVKFSSELEEQINLAEERGAFPAWDISKEYDDEGSGPMNPFYEFMFDHLEKELWIEDLDGGSEKRDESYWDGFDFYKEHGRRNISWSTVAPTGSLSIMAQVTSGIEPLFAPYYTRRKKINPSDDNARVDFVDQNGDSWQEYLVIHKGLEQCALRREQNKQFQDTLIFGEGIADISFLYDKDELERKFQESPYHGSTAPEIDWIDRVEVQSIVQKYTTHSISSTINLPSDVSVDKVKEIYMEAWKKGLKGITVYRDGARSGVLITDSERSSEFPEHDTPERPKTLEADVYHSKSEGKEWVICVGLLEDKPFEVFAYPKNGEEYPPNRSRAKITKKGSGKFILHDDDGKEYVNLAEVMDEQRGAITILASGMLQHGAKVDFVNKRLKKADPNITSFVKAVQRTLRRYNTEDEGESFNDCETPESCHIKHEEGCVSCLTCGRSKCA